jgi:hypothetical protein
MTSEHGKPFGKYWDATPEPTHTNNDDALAEELVSEEALNPSAPFISRLLRFVFIFAGGIAAIIVSNWLRDSIGGTTGLVIAIIVGLIILNASWALWIIWSQQRKVLR